MVSLQEAYIMDVKFWELDLVSAFPQMLALYLDISSLTG